MMANTEQSRALKSDLLQKHMQLQPAVIEHNGSIAEALSFEELYFRDKAHLATVGARRDGTVSDQQSNTFLRYPIYSRVHLQNVPIQVVLAGVTFMPSLRVRALWHRTVELDRGVVLGLNVPIQILDILCFEIAVRAAAMLRTIVLMGQVRSEQGQSIRSSNATALPYFKSLGKTKDLSQRSHR